MSQVFFEKIDHMFEEYLNYPVPALLLEEIRETLSGFLLTEGQKDFQTDFPEGKKGEKLVKNLLVLKGYDFIRFNDTNEYDLLMGLLKNNELQEVKFEVKTDFIAGPNNGGTKNIAIEEECRGKKSGINVTAADFWVHLVPREKEIGFIKVNKLKDLISELKSEGIGRLHEIGGDKASNTVNYLVPYTYFKSHFKVVSL